MRGQINDSKNECNSDVKLKGFLIIIDTRWHLANRII